MSDTPICGQCGAEMIDKTASNHQWTVYPTTCPNCGAKSVIDVVEFARTQARRKIAN